MSKTAEGDNTPPVAKQTISKCSSRLQRVQKSHEELAWYYAAWSNVIMWNLVGTSVAATILAGLDVRTQQSQGVKVATVVLTAVAAFMSAWQRLLLPGVLADRHGLAAIRYAHLLEGYKTGGKPYEAGSAKEVQLRDQSPNIPTWYNYMKYRWCSGCWYLSPGFVTAQFLYYACACFCLTTMSRESYGKAELQSISVDGDNTKKIALKDANNPRRSLRDRFFRSPAPQKVERGEVDEETSAILTPPQVAGLRTRPDLYHSAEE